MTVKEMLKAVALATLALVWMTGIVAWLWLMTRWFG